MFDNPDLVAACVVGDGEAETGPMAASWHSNKFLSPATDGAVLPILHLNGYKIANPAVLARIGQDELLSLFAGYGYKPYLVEGDDPKAMHQLIAATLDEVLEEIREIQNQAREGRAHGRPAWPMIILKTPKGWTGPKEVDGLKTEGFWRSHQVPFAEMAAKPEHVNLLERWMKSYRPEELFGADGALMPEIAALAPQGIRRMSANGGLLMHELDLPELAAYAIKINRPGEQTAESPGSLRRISVTSSRPAKPSGISACFARMKPYRTGCPTCSRQPAGPGMRKFCPTMSIWLRVEG